MRSLQVSASGPGGLRLVNLSELSPEWNWLGGPMARDVPDWHHVSSSAMLRRWPTVGDKEARFRAVRAVDALLRSHAGPKLLVSHGPRPANYWGNLGRARVDAHLVYSFNFTAMPSGLERSAMRRAFKRVSRFVVASRWERDHYARYFGIPEDRLHFQPWGVRQPAVSERFAPPLFDGRYICALGSQARDYACLFEAVRQLPDMRCVVIATNDSVRGLQIPPNVSLMTGVPLDVAMNVLSHSQLMVLPLNDPEARCGHVTAVSALHRAIPVVATSCRGLDDYLFNGKNALTVPPRDPRAMAEAIQRLLEDEAEHALLGQAGLAFAQEHCTEESVVRQFRLWLQEQGLLPNRQTEALQ